ncbi:hypothetical protein EU545_02590 [Candidatus Thorarchaeota archaeon]|nr:MAG: hypothetical protein EU545_02590 [Candidatus Thorarchaeota archaeon]
MKEHTQQNRASSRSSREEERTAETVRHKDDTVKKENRERLLAERWSRVTSVDTSLTRIEVI